MFEVSGSYEGLVKKLKFEGVDYMKNLPYVEMSIAVVDEFDIEDNTHLPGDETVVTAGESHDELITYLIVTKNNKGDLTKHTDADRFYDQIIGCNMGGGIILV